MVSFAWLETDQEVGRGRRARPAARDAAGDGSDAATGGATSRPSTSVSGGGSSSDTSLSNGATGRRRRVRELDTPGTSASQ
jgi:hypothetical protein